MSDRPTPPPSGAPDARPYPDDTALGRALLANALFSTLSGMALLGAPEFVASILGAVPVLVVGSLGAGLIVFGVTVALVAARRPVHPLPALAITVADVGWVLGSLALILAAGEVLSPGGRITIGVVAAMVALFATLQLRGLILFARNVGGRTRARSRFVLARPVPGHPDLVWPRIRALDRIGEFHDALTSVQVREVDGTTVRSCANRDGDRWSEEVMELDDTTREVVLRFDTEDGAFPIPATEMVGGWRVWPHGDGSLLVLWYEYSLRGGRAGEIMAALSDPLFRRQLTPAFEKLGAGGPAGRTLEEVGSR